MTLKKNLVRAAAAVSAMLVSATAFAQTASTTVTAAPGVPTTALGGAWAVNAALLVVGAALVAVGVLMYRGQRKIQTL
jgi:hypothetical protein